MKATTLLKWIGLLMYRLSSFYLFVRKTMSLALFSPILHLLLALDKNKNRPDRSVSLLAPRCPSDQLQAAVLRLPGSSGMIHQVIIAPPGDGLRLDLSGGTAEVDDKQTRGMIDEE